MCVCVCVVWCVCGVCVWCVCGVVCVCGVCVGCVCVLRSASLALFDQITYICVCVCVCGVVCLQLSNTSKSPEKILSSSIVEIVS